MPYLDRLTVRSGAGGGSASRESNWARIWRDFRITTWFLAFSLSAGTLVLLLQGVGARSIAFAASFAALAVGGVLGFLFGIPRVLQGDGAPESPQPGAGGAVVVHSASYKIRVNTNLEQISDWLTKIIVGVGLIELRSLPGAFTELAERVGSGLGRGEPAVVFAGGLLVYFAAVGFLGGYLMTRIYLAGAFSRADWGAQNTVDLAESELRRRINEEARDILRDDPDAAKKITAGQIRVAERIERAAEQVDLGSIRKQVTELAREYEQIRASMPSGEARTRRMELVATKMRTVALAAVPLLPDLAKSDSPGERLAAAEILQVSPRLEYVPWLAARFREDAPFIQYHAAVALLSAARVLGQAEGSAIRSAIAEAKKQIGDKDTASDRWSTLDSAERELG